MSVCVLCKTYTSSKVLFFSQSITLAILSINSIKRFIFTLCGENSTFFHLQDSGQHHPFCFRTEEDSGIWSIAFQVSCGWDTFLSWKQAKISENILLKTINRRGHLFHISGKIQMKALLSVNCHTTMRKKKKKDN